MVAYVGVRLNATELADPTIAADLQRMDLTAIVDSATALTAPRALQLLADAGVEVASGGRGEWPGPNGGDHDPTLWTRARSDAEAGQLLERLIGGPVRVVVPGRRVNAWDLIECGDAHSSLVVPDHVVDADHAAFAAAPIHVTDRRIYLVNGLDATPPELDAVLIGWPQGLALAHLEAVPLDALA